MSKRQARTGGKLVGVRYCGTGWRGVGVTDSVLGVVMLNSVAVESAVYAVQFQLMFSLEITVVATRRKDINAAAKKTMPANDSKTCKSSKRRHLNTTSVTPMCLIYKKYFHLSSKHTQSLDLKLSSGSRELDDIY
jgi:hypothetical protein